VFSDPRSNKSNICNLSNENLRELNAKFHAAKEIEELRNYQKNSMEDETRTINTQYESVRNLIDMLKHEVRNY
jgi:hypothetical protein